jgi:DNA-binding NtrC family response regulator
MDYPIILIFGRDPRLLETRAWLLIRTGAVVLSATSLTEVEKTVAIRKISLLVICHSVAPEDCETVLAAVNELQPCMKKLLMTADTPLLSLGQAERTQSAFEGPAALLQTVQTMLQSIPVS